MSQNNQTVTVPLKKNLVKDLQRMADYLGMSMPEVIHQAITNELARLNHEHSHNDRRLAHLQTDILSQAQSLNMALDGEEEQSAVCEICLTPISESQRPVEGPLLCNDCMRLARSGEASNAP